MGIVLHDCHLPGLSAACFMGVAAFSAVVSASFASCSLAPWPSRPLDAAGFPFCSLPCAYVSFVFAAVCICVQKSDTCAKKRHLVTFGRNRRESAKRPKKGGIREKSPTQAGPAAGRGVRACTRRPRCVGRGKVGQRREAAERRRDMTSGERPYKRRRKDP